MSSSLLQVVNNLFQTCYNKLGTSSANRTCWQFVNRLVTICLQTCNNLCIFTTELYNYWRSGWAKTSGSKNMADFHLCWRQIHAIWFLRLKVFTTDKAQFWSRLTFCNPPPLVFLQEIVFGVFAVYFRSIFYIFSILFLTFYKFLKWMKLKHHVCMQRSENVGEYVAKDDSWNLGCSVEATKNL